MTLEPLSDSARAADRLSYLCAAFALSDAAIKEDDAHAVVTQGVDALLPVADCVRRGEPVWLAVRQRGRGAVGRLRVGRRRS